MNDRKTTYTPKMPHPDDLRPKTLARPDLRIECMTTPCPEFNKFLHTVVGQTIDEGPTFSEFGIPG